MVPRSVPPGLRAFALIWFGQLVSGLGSGLTGFGLGVYLYELTGSATQFALNSLFYVLPIGLVQFVAGALVDRWDRRRVLIIVDIGQAGVTLLIGVLLAANQLLVWQIYLLTIVSAVLRAFQGPAYEASVALLVPKQHLTRAAGMSQISAAISHLVTPVLAGLLVVVIGLFGIIWIDLCTFIIAIITLLIVRIPSPQQTITHEQAQHSLIQEILGGWRYLLERPGLLGMNVLSYIHDFLINIALVLTVPMVLSFADPGAVGLIVAAGGAGLLLGGTLMSIWRAPVQPMLLFLGAIAFDGVALIIMGSSTNILVIATGRFVFFIGFAVYAGILRSTLQRKIVPAIQGRVFGAIGALAMLTEAPAYPVGGFLADRLFEPLLNGQSMPGSFLGALIGTGPGRGMGLLHSIAGICLFGVALSGALQPRIRRLETEIPDVAADDD